MTTSREIKKALTKAFKGTKFSVTTRNVLCETITIKWTGYPFINQVKEVTAPWDTFENHSDIQSDYFCYSGTEIKFDRTLSAEEAEFVVPTILNEKGRTVDNDPIEFRQTEYSEGFNSKTNSGYYRATGHNEMLEAYHLNGLAVELDSYEAKCSREAYLFNTDKDTWNAKREQEQLQKETAEAIQAAERLAKQAEMEKTLITGDYAEGQTNGNVSYIQIHWHEGYQCIKEEAKFATFKSAHDAILKVYQNELAYKEETGHGGYTKLKFSVVYTDGEVYTGRLDLSEVEDNPTATDNIIKQHCTEFLNYSRSQGEEEAPTYNYTFDDAYQQSDLAAVSQEWLLNDNHAVEVSTGASKEGVSTQELQAMFSRIANQKLQEHSQEFKKVENPEVKYTAWVQKKISQGLTSKIVSFGDWLDIHNA